MNDSLLKDNLARARKVAAEAYGENPSPEIVAAVLNAITAQELGAKLDTLTSDLCRAAAVAAGS